MEGTGEDCSPQPLATTVDVNGAAGAPGRSVATDGSGRFRIELAPGRYQLAARPVDPIGSSQPAYVTVTEGLVTEVTLTVDSGIR